MGPTASGKTALAEYIAARLPVELISVDSALVYRGMDIGTGKTGMSTPHRLVDIADPVESYSAARFRDDALAAMEAISGSGRVPLLVGGTMLYFRALFGGLAAMPAADPAVRAAIDARAARDGWDALHAELARVDPAAAARIHPNDPQRIQRALEVWEITGSPISELQERSRRTGGAPTDEHAPVGAASGRRDDQRYCYSKLAVAPADRAELHRRIEARFAAMLEQGLLDEVARLRARGDLDPDMAALRAVGYRQVWDHLDGGCDLDEAARRAVYATRQLAKRQLTWLRREPGLEWLDSAREGWLDEGLAWADAGL